MGSDSIALRLARLLPQFTIHHFPVDLGAHQAQSIQRLQTVGPRVPVEVHLSQPLAAYYAQQSLPIPQPQTGWALIDTGASASAVDRGALQALSIQPISTVQVHTPSGQSTQFAHPVRLAFPGTGLPDWPLHSVLGTDLAGQQLLALVGRDILRHMVLVYSGVIGVVTLAI